MTIDKRDKLIILSAGLAYVGGAGFAVRLGLDPRHYSFDRPEQRAAWDVPWPLVAFVCLLMLGELLVVVVALGSPAGRPVWRRAGLGAATLALWAVPSTLFGYLHAPGFLTWHALWVWGLLAVLVVSTAVSLATAGARRLTRGMTRPGRGPRPAA